MHNLNPSRTNVGAAAPDTISQPQTARRLGRCLLGLGLGGQGLLLGLAACLLSLPASAMPDYEPFSDATASGGTSYSTGSFLAGQTDAGGQSWWELGPNVGTGGVQPTVAAGDLTVPGLASSGGGQSAAFGGNGDDARLNLSVGTGGITAGTVYFSFALRLTDLTGLTSGGTWWAGFNNVQSQNVGTTRANTVVTRVMTRSATGGYNIGLQEGSTGSSFNTAWDSTVYTTSDTVLVVGSYTFNPGTGDDVSQLWVNPASSSFGAATEPGGALSSSGGSDIARIASFILYDRSTAEPAGGLIDDLRFGQSWAEVTPVPEPSMLALGALGLGGLFLRRRAGRTA